MEKQLIISIGREYGSGGHVIAEALAQRFGLPLYDSNLLECVEAEKKVGQGTYGKYDEKPRSRLFYRTVKGYSNSPQENVARMQFDFLKKMAAEGKSFVVVGRCSEYVLKGFPALISVFVLGDFDCKQKRIMERYHLSPEEAKQRMKKEDWSRKSYHNYYCDGKWGDSRSYDLSINSSRLGVDKTVDMLEEYIKERMAL